MPTRIARVRRAEKMPIDSDPNTFDAWAPAIVAPTVWAMVLSTRMDVMPSSSWVSLSLIIRLAPASP